MKKKLFRDGPYADFFSQGVQVGNILTLAGQLGTDAEGNTPEDIKGQMVNCYENIKSVLAEFDATIENIIDETWFVTDVDECMENVSEIFSEREKIYGCKPELSQTLIGTSALVAPNLKIEIKCIAYLD
jgi:enamine deaminase RidA (YjgF/YER057c/UK114 family)